MQDVFTESYLRANIIAWLPIQQEDTVLYIGEENDMIGTKLKELSGSVTGIPPESSADTFKAALLRGNWEYIICLGTLAKLGRRESEERLEGVRQVLNMFGGALSKSGKLILAVENIFGLKYFAGVKEEGSKDWFGAVESSPQSAGYTREELLPLLRGVGLTECSCYYPFPDYRFAMAIYSDAYQPRLGELIDQVGNFDMERLIFFDETKAADVVIRQGRFREFSNSYLFAAGKAGSILVNEQDERISYVKFSNDRAKEHNIRTFITTDADGTNHLLKLADTADAAAQISNMEQNYHALSDIFENTKFSANRCKPRTAGVEFEFLKGHTMEEELDFLLEQGDTEGAKNKLLEVLSEIKSCRGQQKFQMTEEFRSVFGSVELPPKLLAFSAADIDMILPNILIQDDSGDWTVIDYEWMFHFPVPVNYVLYRVIHYYAETTATRRILDAAALYGQAGITEREQAVYGKMERAFQSYVIKSHVPLRQLYHEGRCLAYHLTSLLYAKREIEQRHLMQVYFDRGNGTREDDCINYRSKSFDGEFQLEIPVDDNVTAVRIDPAVSACTVEIRRLCFPSSKEDVVKFYGPAHKVGGQIYLLEAEDPYLLITDLPEGERRLLLDMRVETISLAAAKMIAPKIDPKYRIKKMLKR